MRTCTEHRFQIPFVSGQQLTSYSSSLEGILMKICFSDQYLVCPLCCFRAALILLWIEPPQTIPLVNARLGEAFPRRRYIRRRPSGRKKSKARLVIKKDSSPLLYWKSPGCMGCYNATGVPESRAGQRTDGWHEDHSHAIDFAQFWEKCVDYECLRYQRQFRWQFGDKFANVRDGLLVLVVATSRVDVQTADDLLDNPSPADVWQDVQ